MERDIRKKFQQIEVGEIQSFKNVSIFPLISKIKPPVKHLVLKEAMDKGLLTIGEVSEGGHVPELTTGGLVLDIKLPE